MNFTQQVDPFAISGKQRFFTVYVDRDTGYICQVILTEGGTQGKIKGSLIDYENKPSRAPEHYFLAYTDENKKYFKDMKKRMVDKGYLPK